METGRVPVSDPNRHVPQSRVRTRSNDDDVVGWLPLGIVILAAFALLLNELIAPLY